MATEMKKQSIENEMKKKGSSVELVLTLWAWTMIVIVVSIFFFVQLLLFLVTFPFDKQRYYVGRLFRISSAIANSFNLLWDFKLVGKLPTKLPERTVCISNHLSLADSSLISLLPWEMKWLSKTSLFLVPFMGWSMYLAGDVPLHRGDKNSAKKAMEQCKIWLETGTNVMIFPEGTRSKSGKMGEFKDGAFRLAIETQSDLLPIALAGTSTCIPVSAWKMSYAKGRVMVGTPISTKGLTDKDVQSLKEQARKQVEDMYCQLLPLVQ